MWWVLTLISGMLLSLGVQQWRPRVLRQYSSLDHLTRDGCTLESHLIQRFQILANTSSITSDHPTIEAVIKRWRSGSLPGQRSDGFKIGLSIEGINTHFTASS